MRLTFEYDANFDLYALHAALVASSIPGITGISTDYGNLYVEIPTRQELKPEEIAAIEQLVALHISIPSWDEIRRQRASMLAEVDWRIDRAEDCGERQEELRTYRQALRDITKQSDPNNVAWPAKPW